MMNKTQSPPRRTWRYLLLLPVLTLTAGLLSATRPASTDTTGNKYLAEENGILYGVITPSTSDKDFEEIKNALAERNKTLTLPLLQRNANGDIDHIIFKINDSAATMSMHLVDEPMATFFFYSGKKESGIGPVAFEKLPQSLINLAIKESNSDIKGLTTDSTYAERYPGGRDALARRLSQTIRYPRVCQENNIAGNVTIQYKIRPDGAISDIEVLEAPHKALGEEVKRAIGELSAFRADPSGKTVTVTMHAAYMLEKPNGESIQGPDSERANRDIVIVGYARK